MVISALICFANSGQQLGWATLTRKGTIESQDSTGEHRGSRESHYSFVTPLRSPVESCDSMVPLRVTVAQPNCWPEFAKQIKAEITITFLTQILGQGQLSNCPVQPRSSFET